MCKSHKSGAIMVVWGVQSRDADRPEHCKIQASCVGFLNDQVVSWISNQVHICYTYMWSPIFVHIQIYKSQGAVGLFCEGEMSQEERRPPVTGISSDLKTWRIRAGGGFGDYSKCIKQKIKYKARLENRMDGRWHSIVGLECLVLWAPGFGQMDARTGMFFCTMNRVSMGTIWRGRQLKMMSCFAFGK
jgi:hypothetical protein